MSGQQAEVEVADELVDEASINDGKAIVKFMRTEAALVDLRIRFKDAKFDLATTKGDTAARQARRELVSLRTGLDKRRKELKAPAVEFNRKIDSEAQRITGEITALEEPIDLQIKQDEQRREDERVARLRAEEARCDAHRQRIADITNVAVRAVGLPSSDVQAKIDLVTRVVIGDDFEEFAAAAINGKAETLLKLNDLLAAAKGSEAREAEAQRTRERLAQLEREDAERRERDAVEQRRREAAEAETRRIEQERVAAEQCAQQRRAAQSQSANELVDEIRRVQKRAFTTSSTGMLELVRLVEAISIGPELGDFAGVAEKARDDALADLHDMHQAVLARETEAKRVREEQADAQRRLDEQAAELRRQQEVVAARERAIMPVEPENVASMLPDVDSPTEEQERRRGLELTLGVMEKIDAKLGPVLVGIDPGTPVDQQDDGEGNTPDIRPDIITSEIARRLGFVLTTEFIERKLGVPLVRTEKRAMYWREADWPVLCAALIAHIEAAVA